MKTNKLFIILSLFFLPFKASSQDFQLTPPDLQFDGKQLLILYDIVNKDQADQFYVWVEMEKKSGEKVKIKALTGDIGEKIQAGKNKRIVWIPERDSVFLDEDVLVEVKAEKYIKSFNRGSAMLMSGIFPGLGQTKISKGKPFWLTGVVAYGALAGGLIEHQSYIKTYDSYKTETDPSKRVSLRNKAQSQANLSGTLFISGAALWVVNLVWVAVIPDNYKPLTHAKLSFEQLPDHGNGTMLLSMKFNF
jgi:hypothetical protein